ncbi:hypothetical protein B0H19DRAFT_76931 [Mycena capillaripes]|nr:hypothetical protein B0H19DRAFT_76931 [Mycena capillaripes]
MPIPLCLESGFANRVLKSPSPPPSLRLVFEVFVQRLFSPFLRRTRSARSFASLRVRLEISYPLRSHIASIVRAHLFLLIFSDYPLRPPHRPESECASSLSLRPRTYDTSQFRQTLTKHALLARVHPASSTSSIAYVRWAHATRSVQQHHIAYDVLDVWCRARMACAPHQVRFRAFPSCACAPSPHLKYQEGVSAHSRRSSAAPPSVRQRLPPRTPPTFHAVDFRLGFSAWATPVFLPALGTLPATYPTLAPRFRARVLTTIASAVTTLSTSPSWTTLRAAASRACRCEQTRRWLLIGFFGRTPAQT